MRKWLLKLLDIVFYVGCLFVAYIALIVLCVASFKVSSNSMTPTLIPNDYILVDKCRTGARLFNVWHAGDGKDVNVYRLPGWRRIKRNDIIVFNSPYQYGREDSIVFDVMKYYVKRCIALPGDTLEIQGGYFKISGVDGTVGRLESQLMVASSKDTERDDMEMEKNKQKRMHIITPTTQLDVFPGRNTLGWTISDFGPLAIPKRGRTIKMDSISWLLYRPLIEWEQKKTLELSSNNTVKLGDSILHEYTFQEDYYSVVGDNSLASWDSRYWGLLPEKFIVGRAWLIWKSEDPKTGQLRWNRVMKRIE